MFPYLRSLLAAALVGLCGAAHANNCEPIRAKIEAQIRDAGVTVFSVTVMPQDAPASGEVVGSCDNGQQKIVYTRGVAPLAPVAAPPPAAASPTKPQSPAPARRAQRPTPEAEIITECKDGTVSVGGRCER
jgi:hypothetical protein